MWAEFLNNTHCEEEKTATIDMTLMTKRTHQPNHAKADILEATARGYEMLWTSTGAKHYYDKMKACFDDARDYRSCGFVRPVGATVSEANNS